MEVPMVRDALNALNLTCFMYTCTPMSIGISISPKNVMKNKVSIRFHLS